MATLFLSAHLIPVISPADEKGASFANVIRYVRMPCSLVFKWEKCRFRLYGSPIKLMRRFCYLL